VHLKTKQVNWLSLLNLQVIGSKVVKFSKRSACCHTEHEKWPKTMDKLW
jgi:hypothetical protein